MFQQMDNYKIIAFFCLNYVVLSTMLLTVVKFFQNGFIQKLNVLFSKKVITCFLVFTFFLISGIPLTLTFFLKWLCLLQLFKCNMYITYIVFVPINVLFLVFYFNTFNIISSYKNLNSSCDLRPVYFLKTDYYISLFTQLTFFLNVFGFLYINWFFVVTN